MNMLRLFLLSAVVWMASCSTTPDAITGTETGNGSNGVVSFADGTLARDARVTMVPSHYEELNPPVGDFMIMSTTTDSAGQYRFENLIEGYYNLFIEKDGYKSVIDSVFVADTPAMVKPCVLKKTGALSGKSYYSSGSFPAETYLVITGSRYYTRLDEKTGAFHLSDIPAGVYKARIAGPVVDYFQKSFSVSIPEGATDTLREPVVLVSKSVTSLLPAGDGSLWVGTTNGLLHLSAGGWTSFGLHDGLTSSHITSIGKGGDSTIWIGTTFRLARFTGKKLASNYDFIGTIKAINVKAMESPSPGEIWFGSGDGLFANDSGAWLAFSQNSRADNASPGSSDGSDQLRDVSAIAFSGATALIGTRHGLFTRDLGGKWSLVEPLGNVSINDIEVIDSAVFLVATSNGLYRCSADSVLKIDIAASGRADAVTAILCSGNRWFAGTENGLYLFDNDNWTLIDMSPLSGFITAIVKDTAGSVWIGTNNGLCRYHNATFDIIR